MKKMFMYFNRVLFLTLLITIEILTLGFKKTLAQEVTIEVQSKNFKDLAVTPPMGWNSWNWFGKKDINEEIVTEVIDAMVNEGLRDAGYVYVVVDGGWRDNKLGPNGELMPNPDKFPHGIKPLADYAHSKGLKFGSISISGCLKLVFLLNVGIFTD